MIATVSLNPCIDKTLWVDQFTYGGMNRVVKSRIDPAGKGINVAIAYKNIGGEAYCIGLNYEEDVRLIPELLDSYGIGYSFVNVKGNLRTNIKIFDNSRQIVTEVNEAGNPATLEDVTHFMEQLAILKGKISTLVLSGSIPGSMPASIYAKIITMMRDTSVKCILDAEGEILSEGIKEKPYLVKPNLHELQTIFGAKLQNQNEVVRAARAFIDIGVRIVVVSLSDKGALLLDENDVYLSPALNVKIKGTAGAGDSMIAGLCLAIERCLEPEMMLRYGMAAATAKCMNEGTLLCTKPDFENILKLVEVKRLNN